MLKRGLTFKDTRTFSQADFDAFAKLSGDDNPIHVDPEFASRTAFAKPVAHGMMLYGTICGLLSRHFPGALQLSQRLTFPAPTFAAEKMTICAQITNIDEGRIFLATTIVDPKDQTTCEGETLLCVQKKRDDIFSQIPREPAEPSQDAISFNKLRLGQSASTKRIFNENDVSAYRALTADSGLAYGAETAANDWIIPGPLLGGIVSDLLGTELPGRGTNWLKQQYSWFQPVFVGEEIEAIVEIIRLRPHKSLVNLRTTLTASGSRFISSGEALVLVKDLAPEEERGLYREGENV